MDYSWTHAPVLVVAVFGLMQAYGLNAGKAWAYRLGVTVARIEEEFSVPWTHEARSAEQDEFGLYPLSEGRFGVVDWSSQISGSASSGGVTTLALGMLCFGVLHVEVLPAGVRFRFERRLGLFGPAMFAALMLSLWLLLGPQMREPWFLGGAALLFGAVIGLASWWGVRKLSAPYHLFTAEMVDRAVHPR